ncbi:MAG TPA: hypothetical protein VGX23_30445 [Actinocrinis sp.]|nr:hypothetical protein [Actinocrinis sp.]
MYGPAHTANVDGTLETIRSHTADTYDVGAPNSDSNPATSKPYMLETSEVVSASVGTAVPATTTADARTTRNVYGSGSDTEGWSLGTPEQTITDPSGLDITTTYQFNENVSLYNGAALQTSKAMPSNSGSTAGTAMIYYTAGTNSVNAACGNQPQWANLLCLSSPFAQPSDTNTIPSIAYTYNAYLSVLTMTETYGSTGTRTTTHTYDSADRPLTTAVAVTGSGMGSAVPTTQEVYAPASGLPADAPTDSRPHVSPIGRRGSGLGPTRSAGA